MKAHGAFLLIAAPYIDTCVTFVVGVLRVCVGSLVVKWARSACELCVQYTYLCDGAWPAHSLPLKRAIAGTPYSLANIHNVRRLTRRSEVEGAQATTVFRLAAK